MNKLAFVSLALLASACLMRGSGSTASSSSPASAPAPAPQPAAVPTTTPAPAPAPAPKPTTPLLASKSENAQPAATLPSKGPIYIAATLSSSIDELLAERGTCRQDAKRWVNYHVKVNGAVPHKDARKSMFHSDLFDATQAKTKSVGGWLVPKVKDRGPTIGYAFEKHVAPMLVAGANQLELWVVVTCPPSDVLADEIEVELARGALVIER